MSAAPGTQTNAYRAILAERSVATVIALALFVNLGTGIVLPVLPLYARSLGADYGATGLLVGAYFFARLLSDIAAGRVLSWLGVRRTAVSGLALLAVGALLTGVSRNFPMAVVCWAAAGFGAGTLFAAMYNALILGVAKQRMARALSLFYGAFNSGWVAGGFIGGIVAGRFGLNAPLFGLAVIAMALAIVMERYLVEPHPLPSPLRKGEGELPGSRKREEQDLDSRNEQGVLSLFRIPGFGAAVVAVLANLWMFGAVFNTLTPLFARDVLHLTTTGIGVLYAIALAAEFLVYYPAGTWADTRGRRFVLIPSFAFVVISTMILGFAPNLVTFTILFGVAGLASGFAGVPPAAVLADVVPEGQSARGVATFRFGADVGYTLGPLVSGLVAASFGFKAAFIAAALPSVLALVVITLGPETLRRHQTA